MRRYIVNMLTLVGTILGLAVPSLAQTRPEPRGEVHLVELRRAATWVTQKNVYDQLIQVSEDGTLLPRLATSWRWLDDRTLEMSLRRDVVFHNGERFDAEAVKRTWDVIAEFVQYYGKLPWQRFHPDARLEVIDAYTIRLILPEPDVSALLNLGTFWIPNRQFHRHLTQLAKAQKQPRARLYWRTLRSPGPWGTGPYRHVKGAALHRERTKTLVLEANRAYWDPTRLPRVQRVVLNFTLSREQAIKAIKTSEGQVDLVTGLRPLDTLAIAQSPYAKVVKERQAPLNVVGFFNTRMAGSPWHDVRLRRAVNHAINRDHFIRYATKGNGIVTPSLLPPVGFGYDAALMPYTFDPSKTRQLMQEAGYPAGRPLTLIAPEDLAAQATVVSKMLEQAGFSVQHKVLNAKALYEQTSLFRFLGPHIKTKRPWPTWDIALMRLGNIQSIGYLPTALYHTYILGGYYDWVEEAPVFDRLYAELIGTRDRHRHLALVRQMERHIRDQAYFLFLYAPLELYAVNKAVWFTPRAGGNMTLDLTGLAVTDEHWSVRRQKATMAR